MIELIYTSVTPKKLDMAAVSDILESSKLNNRLNNITGYLYYDGQRFLQILEGEHELVYNLFDKIEKDPRHESVELLYEQEIETRSFPDWQMAYAALTTHSLYNPIQNIESINNDFREVEEVLTPNFGAAMFKIFRDSYV